MSDLENQWAWSQVEAMADASLAAGDERRMRAAMAGDPELRKAVGRAVSLRRELARLGRAAPPRGLARRLLRLPADGVAPRSERRSPPVLAFGIAAAAAVAVAAGVVVLLASPQRAAGPTESHAAVENFRVAMTYLQHSTAFAGTEVSAALGDGLRDALAISGRAAHEKKQQRKNGG